MLPLGFLGGSDSKESARNVGDLFSFTGLGRSPGGGHGSPLQCSYLENPQSTEESDGLQSMESQSDMTERPSVAQHSTLPLAV